MPILSEKERLLRKIQACSFALVEANLYLDSHPTCRDGLAYFARHKAEKEKLIAQYNEKYGPLTITQNNSSKKWEWVTSPFPWERSVTKWQYEKKRNTPLRSLTLILLWLRSLSRSLVALTASLVQRFAISISVTQPPVVKCRQYSTISAQKNLPTSK